MTATGTKQWDAELYEARHSFVWQYGLELVDLLDPREGQRVLDVGCGTGHLTAAIAQRGAHVLGLDASPAMVAQARQNFPHLPFELADATAMRYAGEFDAAFSNAVLHWILDTDSVAKGLFRALRPGGRLVLECGGRGNIQLIEHAIQETFAAQGLTIPASRTLFRSIGELSGALERAGLEVASALLFHRPTRLEGSDGMSRWLEQFSSYYLEAVPAANRAEVLQWIVDRLRPVLFRDGVWYADYRRLRVIAAKPY